MIDDGLALCIVKKTGIKLLAFGWIEKDINFFKRILDSFTRNVKIHENEKCNKNAVILHHSYIIYKATTKHIKT